jgi:hypothetical protein
VAARVPVLRENDVLESLAETVDERDDLIPSVYCERAAGAEVVLDIDHQQDVSR